MTGSQRGGLSTQSKLALLPLFLAAGLFVVRWKSGVSFFEPSFGVPALVVYLACGVLTATTVVLMLGPKEANAKVAGIGFVIGASVLVAFDAWSGWRSALLGIEVLGFVLVLLVAPIWCSFSFRTPTAPPEEEPESEW